MFRTNTGEATTGFIRRFGPMLPMWHDDNHLIPAKEAFYVIGSDMNGSMGPTLATFSAAVSAKAFVSKHGGRLLSFENLITELQSKH